MMIRQNHGCKKYPVVLSPLLLLMLWFSPPVASESRYSTYKPNYALFFSKRKNDDIAVAVRLSGRYDYLRCADATAVAFCKKATFGSAYNFKSFISYTHEFDFYMWGNSVLGRPSEPVVNRMTSPALHFEWSGRKNHHTVGSRVKDRVVTVSLVHQSNGQSLDRESQFGGIDDSAIPTAVESIERLNPAWRDNISRGWNYLEAKLKFDFLLGSAQAGDSVCEEIIACSALSIAVKTPIGPIDDEVWWAPGNTSKYADYNIAEITYSNEFLSAGENPDSRQINLTLSCGARGCGGSIWTRLELRFPFKNLTLPWMIYIRGGPNEHFYNYHERTFSAGFGFQFQP